MSWSLKRTISSLAESLGYEIRNMRRPHSLFEFLRSREVGVVIDAGANTGQFAAYLRGGGYKGEIVSFEPLASAFALLEEKARRDPHWTVYNCALGAAEGSALLNVAKSSDFSSFKQVSKVADIFGDAASTVADQVAGISTLDKFLQDHLAGKTIFLKLDTQGYDREILEGAASSFDRIAGIQVELSSTPLYQDTWDMPQALDYLKQRGYSVCQIRPTTYSDDSGIVLEFDVVFYRAAEKAGAAARPDVP